MNQIAPFTSMGPDPNLYFDGIQSSDVKMVWDAQPQGSPDPDGWNRFSGSLAFVLKDTGDSILIINVQGRLADRDGYPSSEKISEGGTSFKYVSLDFWPRMKVHFKDRSLDISDARSSIDAYVGSTSLYNQGPVFNYPVFGPEFPDSNSGVFEAYENGYFQLPATNASWTSEDPFTAAYTHGLVNDLMLVA